MWSIQTAPSTSSSLYISSNRFMMSLISARHSPYRTFFRYFGTNTMWYVQSHFVCAELSSCIFFVSCVLVRDALLPLLHFITGDFFLLNYCPCKTHCRTTGRACGFLLVLTILMAKENLPKQGRDASIIRSPFLRLSFSNPVCRYCSGSLKLFL